MCSFIDSGVDLALSMVRFTLSTEWQKQAYGHKTNIVGAIYIEQINQLFTCLLAFVNKSLSYMAKQLNYAWLKVEITV